MRQMKRKKNAESTRSPRQLRADEYTNVRDVKGFFLYTKDHYVIGYLQVSPFNIDLLPKEERKAKASRLAASFEADKKDFAYMSLFREIDLDGYKNVLKQKHRTTDDIGMRHILEEMLLEATELSVNGENFEHQHYIKIWAKIEGERKEAEEEVKQRLEEFRQRFFEIGVTCKLLRDAEIMKMCNLYGNTVQAPFDTIGDNLLYENIMKILN